MVLQAGHGRIEKQEHLRATLIEKILVSVERAIRISKAADEKTLTQVKGSAIQRSLNDYMRIL